MCIRDSRCINPRPVADDLPALALWFAKWAGLLLECRGHVEDDSPIGEYWRHHEQDTIREKCINPRPTEPVTLEAVLAVLETKGYRGVVLAKMVEGGYGACIYDRAPHEPEALFAGSGYGPTRMVALLRAAKAAVEDKG